MTALILTLFLQATPTTESTVLMALSPDLSVRFYASELDEVSELEELHDTEAKGANRREVASQFLPRFEEMATRLAGSEQGLRAELWVLRNHWWKRAEGTMEQVAIAHATRLIQAYKDSPQLTRIAEYSYLYGREGIGPLLDLLIDASPHDRVDAAAIHAQASRLRRSKDKPQTDRARRLLEQLRDQYGDLGFRDTTYRAIATAMLSPHSPDALEVGEIAPEISGVDVTGSAVQLSDHRGKIVLLDFWGDW